jgi:RNA polymerase primary sigma factor
MLKKAATPPVSLQSPVGEDGATLGDFIPDTAGTVQYRTADRTLMRDLFMAVSDSLTEREREVLDYRFGLTGSTFREQKTGRV